MEQKTILNAKFSRTIGQDKVKEQLKSALLSKRHLILVGPPGVGKTTLAKQIAELIKEMEVMDCEYHCLPEDPVCPKCKNKQTKGKKKVTGKELFVRVQGSPDLTAEDLIGDIDPIKAMKYGPLSMEAFTPGKIFKANNGVLFFDEVNRCSEKLQNSLLQVLEEGTVTIGSYDVDIPSNFIFIGTMNPQDHTTEELNDVFLDRFDLLYVSYPESLEKEEEIVLTSGKKIVEVPSELLNWIVEFIRDLRINKDLEKKPSVRATIGLYERSQANALLQGRQKVIFEDIDNCVESVLNHRIKLNPSIKFLKTAKEFIREEFVKYTNEKELGDSG